MNFKLILIGFGTVGQGLVEILEQKQHWLREKFGFEYKIIAVATKLRGSVVNEQGLDGSRLLSLIQNQKNLNDYPAGTTGLSPLEIINKVPADFLLELSPTNLNTGEPATSFCRAALANGINVVTANKGPIALHYQQLKELADKNGVSLGIEGTVMSGTPVINTALNSLAGCCFAGIRGIVNSTTNFILTEMESGKNYGEALAEAQQLGLAETDPTADVDGWDAVAKIVILANVVLGVPLKPDAVARTGIRSLTREDIARAKQEHKRWKLIGELRQRNGEWHASVQPLKLDWSDPLAQVGGRKNGITFDTDLLGPVTVLGSGGGGKATGFAVLTDLLAIQRKNSGKNF